jgi:hypothetical protein
MVYFTKPKVKTDYVLATVNQVHRRADMGKYLNNVEDEIGVELELEGEGLPNAFEKLKQTGCDYWKMARDGSLNESGREFTFTKALNRVHAKKAIQAFYAVFDKEAQLDVSSRCSTHMHLNFQHMSMMQVYSFITLFTILEQPLFEVYAPERMAGEASGYCVPSHKCPQHVQKLNSSLKKGAFNPTQKYRALNTEPLASYGSIECRMLGGSPNADKPLQWMEILLEIYDHIKNNPKLTPQELLDTDDFAAFVEQNLPKVWNGIKHLTNVKDLFQQAIERSYSYAYAVDWQETKTAEPPKNPRKVDPNRINFEDDMVYYDDYID